ncbi:hypothetical protein [Rhodococcus sp. ABRD24]|uniref:hypothetical protein n=1 Tax=Rhodococcus sp. ABRD24 TaxID=2507582 RepID=UPI0013F14E60|nr:hypothetical protein [Rhodococcus sp. ABRD24]
MTGTSRAGLLPALHAVTEDWPPGTTRESYLDGLDVLIGGYVQRFGHRDGRRPEGT